MRNYSNISVFSDILGPLAALVELANDLRVVIKNTEHQYVYVNPHWLKEVGIADAEAVIGKTSVDVFSHWRGDRYIQEEKEVMQSGLVLDYFEDWIDGRGVMERFRAIKAPWIERGCLMGVVNISIPAHRNLSREFRSDRKPNVLAWLTENAMENCSISKIAELHHMSRRSFERSFSQITGISPSKYRLNLRITKSKELLKASGLGISEVALQCGFCDQSHFTRVFRQNLGLTPAQYRKEQGK